MDSRTDEIINRFKDSWAMTERFYHNLINDYPGFERLTVLQQFIANLRDKGEDKYFRLGTSLHTLIISRSVDHGLRLDQKYITIASITTNEFKVTLRDGAKIYREFRITDFEDDRLTKLLNTLRETLVD